MSEIHFQPGDATRPARTAHLSARTGALIAAALVAAGVLVVAGLFGAPDLLSDIIRSAERISLRETAQRGQEAFADQKNHYSQHDAEDKPDTVAPDRDNQRRVDVAERVEQGHLTYAAHDEGGNGELPPSAPPPGEREDERGMSY